jgi:hypothetical protein
MRKGATWKTSIVRVYNMKWIIKQEWNGINWIYLAQDRDKWLDVVETVKILRVL